MQSLLYNVKGVCDTKEPNPVPNRHAFIIGIGFDISSLPNFSKHFTTIKVKATG